METGVRVEVTKETDEYTCFRTTYPGGRVIDECILKTNRPPGFVTVVNLPAAIEPQAATTVQTIWVSETEAIPSGHELWNRLSVCAEKIRSECQHEWLDVGFHFSKHVCSKCNQERHD